MIVCIGLGAALLLSIPAPPAFPDQPPPPDHIVGNQAGDDYEEIYEALAVASDGDILEVRPGSAQVQGTAACLIRAGPATTGSWS